MTQTLRVLAVADHGMSLAHLGTKIAFVPFAAPGDLVEVRVVREKKRYVETDLVRVLEPSPQRRSPPCSVFGRCGGCQWQHLPYPQQVAAKAGSFQGFLGKRVGLPEDGIFLPPLASPREWGYRNRVGLKVRAIRGRVEVGFFARGSHHLVPVRSCPVSHPAIQTYLPELSRFLQEFPLARGQLPQVDLQVDGDNQLWSIWHHLRPLTRGERIQLSSHLDSAGARSAFLQAGRKSTLVAVSERAPKTMPFRVHAKGRDLSLAVSPGGFVQANPEVNQALVDLVMAQTPLFAGRSVLDLFCGAGNFTLPLALEAAAVLGVEGYPPAARDAAANAAEAGLTNVRIRTGPVPAVLGDLHPQSERPAFVLLDPPREGAAEAVGLITALNPEHILYISCAPPTLARDLKQLVAAGYRVQWVRAADMFPQSAHLESATLLAKDL